VVLIDFWTYTCINCIRTLPYLRDWHETYKDSNFVIIGVHTPEFEFEKSAENVEKAIEDFGLEYSVVQDNNYATWRAYNNRYWPAKYLIDKEGKVRYTHFGEGKYDETERMIQRLIRETGTDTQAEIENPSYDVQSRTPELYLGYKRMSHYYSPGEIAINKQKTYSLPQSLPSNSFSFGRSWMVESERSQAFEGSSLLLQYEAREVFLVMRSNSDEPGVVRVYLDGELADETSAGDDVVDGEVVVDKDRLYKLIKLEEFGEHELKLEFLDSNIEVYAFTFG
jgi:thiol-disulfide isomerase/thioredoxin